MTKDQEGPGLGSAVRHEVEAPKITDQLYQAFPNAPTLYGTDPKDGMPRAVSLSTLHDSEVPDLSVEKLVCMADTSSFVWRDEWGDVKKTYQPEEVEQTPSKKYRLKLANPGKYITPPERIEVQPVRPQCHYYARQLVPFPEDRERTFVARLCTARRTDEGEFLSVNDTQVFACELRIPMYGGRVDLLDAADEVSMKMKRAQEVKDDFDLDRALAGEQKKGQ